ncbi:hypothetical protein [Cupriavidus basilensis]
MHAPITYSEFGAVRSLIEERPARPPIIGKIRPGIKVLTKKARESERAVKLHDSLLAQGKSFETIEKEIERATGIRNSMAPKNVGWFTCRRSDFTNPAIADEILARHGEDRGDGLKLWRFPVLFAFDDWLSNMPNQLAAWGASGRQFFSEYGPDGRRYCKTYAPPEKDPRASRVKRNFGGRTIILRQDDDIPDGICDPAQCPQYQARTCNMSASLFFSIVGIKGLGLIELPTNSIYVLQKAYAAMQTVSLARGGRLVGVHFWLSKLEAEISRIDENGRPVRQNQMLTMLDAEIDLGALLDGGDQVPHAIETARQVVGALEASPAAASEAVDTAGDANSSQAPSSGHGPVEGDPEDKAHQLEDLIARLGLASGEDRQDLRVYAHIHYGKGWFKRANDLSSLIEVMRASLADPASFRARVHAAASEARAAA